MMLPQLSLVALYGAKPPSLARLIAYTRQESSYFSGQFSFHPYPITQVHATIIGMERLPYEEELVNQNLFVTRNIKEVMQFSPLKNILKQFLPLNIQIGGYGENDLRFLSNGEKRFMRTISYNPETHKLVAIGWPHSEGDFSERRLWKLRSSLEEHCNLGHKYPEDNDFYMVLGDLTLDKGSEDDILRFIRQMRIFLSDNPFHIDVDLESLSVAVYSDTSLSLQSTQLYPLKPFLTSPDELIKLYR